MFSEISNLKRILWRKSANNIIFATDMKIRTLNGLLEQTVNQNINVLCTLFLMTSMKHNVSNGN